MALPIDQRALVKAYRQQLASLLTEPMNATEVADHFGIGRNKVKAMLKHMPGVERIDSLYRIPVFKMPPAYIRAHGIAPICTTDFD